MAKKLIFLCLVLILCGCVRTVQKYDPYEPDRRSLFSLSLGTFPSEIPEKKKFRDDRDKIRYELSICPITKYPDETYCGRLINDLCDEGKSVESYEKIINDPACLEKFLKLLVREGRAGSPPPFRTKLSIHSKALDILPENSQKEGPVELCFVHLSDVQLRDEEAKLVSRSASRFYDSFVTTVERDPFQEYFDLQYYQALILRINTLIDKGPKKPEFMVHTGDATDVRTSQELYPFVYISNQLKVPWFNVVGNHDAATFGNFNNKRCNFKNVSYSFLSPGNLLNFMLMHGPAYIHDDSPLTPTNVHEDVTWKEGSYFHGFDLYEEPECPPKMEEAFNRVNKSPGYYSLKLRPGIRLIVLNTAIPRLEKGPREDEEEYITQITLSTVPRQCHKGKIDDKQYGWLQGMLKNAKGDKELVLVFGHHPLGPEDQWHENPWRDNTYEDVINLFHEYPNLVAYFCGHTHEQKVRFIEDPNNPKEGFWEINSGSILDYPQEGNLITLYRLGEGYGRIDVESFGVFEEEDFEVMKKNEQRRPSDRLHRLAFLAQYGAEKDWKKDHSYTGAREGVTHPPEKVVPERNNYVLYFPWPDGVNPQQAKDSQESLSPPKFVEKVKNIIEPNVRKQDLLEVIGKQTRGEKGILQRFQIEQISDANRKLFEENPFLYRVLAYLVEMAGEKEGEIWQLVRERQNSLHVH